ncbi:hypothetical protein P691DRAFT_779829 [Macrolepiota fuliginosa MF-IS2]|uniref:Uncharacterized protein n=1 Tax=Macrolepiota fuliginosa MF-IS2 TaxID=1400762 RepID=A0A9P6BX42_9AGAR|nr:hypothetical protein P691DRAFT_779829 [Macrolepiota fuliginosa MF-IS2]
MAISSPPNITCILEYQISLMPSFVQVLQEPEPEPESVARKEPPPSLSLGSTMSTQLSSVESEDHPPSDVTVVGEELGMVEGVVDVKGEDAKVEESKEVEVGPCIEKAGVEAVEAAEVPQVPSSPTTPNVPQLSLPLTQQPVLSQPPASSLLSLPLNLGTNTGSLIRPVSMIELSPTSSTGFNIPDRKINFDDDNDIHEQADHG